MFWVLTNCLLPLFFVKFHFLNISCNVLDVVVIFTFDVDGFHKIKTDVEYANTSLQCETIRVQLCVQSWFLEVHHIY